MEVAAGVVAAEQVISTTIEGGAAAGAAIAYPTLPLKAKFECIGTSPSTDTPDSLARSSHTISLLNGDLYIFGGLVGPTRIAGAEMHILKLSNLGNHDSQYKSIPALPAEGHDEIPAARAGHTTCTVNGEIIMYGGYRPADDGSENKRCVDPSSRFWTFDPKTFFWTGINAVDERVPPRFQHSAVTWKDKVIIHGGYTDDDSGVIKALNDTWSFDLRTRSWTELPLVQLQGQAESEIESAPASLAVANDHLYLVSTNSSLSTKLHMLDLNPPVPPQGLPSSSQLTTTESSETKPDEKPAETNSEAEPAAEAKAEQEPAEADVKTTQGTGHPLPTSPSEPASPAPWQWHTLTIPTNPPNTRPQPQNRNIASSHLHRSRAILPGSVVRPERSCSLRERPSSRNRSILLFRNVDTPTPLDETQPRASQRRRTRTAQRRYGDATVERGSDRCQGRAQGAVLWCRGRCEWIPERRRGLCRGDRKNRQWPRQAHPVQEWIRRSNPVQCG